MPNQLFERCERALSLNHIYNTHTHTHTRTQQAQWLCVLSYIRCESKREKTVTLSVAVVALFSECFFFWKSLAFLLIYLECNLIGALMKIRSIFFFFFAMECRRGWTHISGKKNGNCFFHSSTFIHSFAHLRIIFDGSHWRMAVKWFSLGIHPFPPHLRLPPTHWNCDSYLMERFYINKKF